MASLRAVAVIVWGLSLLAALLISKLSRADGIVRPATCYLLLRHTSARDCLTSVRSMNCGHRDLSTTRIYVSVLNQDKWGPTKSARSAGQESGRRARYPAKPAGVSALSRPAYPASAPWQIPRQVPLAIGLP